MVCAAIPVTSVKWASRILVGVGCNLGFTSILYRDGHFVDVTCILRWVSDWFVTRTQLTSKFVYYATIRARQGFEFGSVERKYLTNQTNTALEAYIIRSFTQ